MAYAPISLLLPQYVDGNGDPYSGAVLKAYAKGTTTNISMATDATGATTFTSVALNANGYPEHSGSIVIPHVDQTYKIALYATQAAADADTPSIWSIDNLTPIAVAGNVTVDDAISSGVTNVIVATHTTTGTPVNGIGTGIAFKTETANDNNETGMVIKSVSTDVSAGSEDFKFVLSLMAAGAAPTDVFEVTNLASLKFLKANPELLGGDTDGTFTFGANTAALGGAVKVYGDTHATKAGDVEVLSNGTVVAHYDLSATKWDLGSNALDCGALSPTSVTLPAGGVTAVAIRDEDNMVSDSATSLATQQSIKKYVDDNSAVGSDVQTFTASGTWTKPGTGTYALIEAWGAGGGGTNESAAGSAAGGGGGEYSSVVLLLSSLGATETVTIGAGGSGGASGSDNTGADGGNTTFGSHVTARGGKGGTVTTGGNGGGGEAGANSGNGDAVGGFGAGGGGLDATNIAGSCTNGGGGGGGVNGGSVGSGGVSQRGGDGGAANTTASTKGGNGVQPGGGGGGSENDGGGGDGANGQVKVTVW